MLRPLAILLVTLVVFPCSAQEVRTEIARQPLPPTLRQRSSPEDTQRIASPIEQPSSPEAAAEFGEQLVLTRQAQWDPWSVDAGVSLFFTDNVALAPRAVEDWFLKYDLGVGYTNRIGGPWSLEVSIAQAMVRYDQFDALDFDLTRGIAGVAYEASWLGDASLFLRYQFYRITDAGFGDEILRNHSLSVGLQKIWKVSQGQQLFFGVSSDPCLEATPVVAERHEHATFGGWSLRLTEKLSAQVSGRVGYHVSPATDRQDWNYVALASAAYAFTDWAHLSVTSSIAWNESDRSIFTYRNVIAGVFVGLHLTF